MKFDQKYYVAHDYFAFLHLHFAYAYNIYNKDERSECI